MHAKLFVESGEKVGSRLAFISTQLKGGSLATMVASSFAGSAQNKPIAGQLL
jgi:hypothetical protein